MDLDDTSTLSTLYGVYKAQYEKQDEVKIVSTKGQYFIVKYNDEYVESEFGNTILTELKALYDRIIENQNQNQE